MSQNKEDIKNKIIYRASYRGTKEMDILMIGFVNSLIHNLNLEDLRDLDDFINMDDEVLKNIKKNKLNNIIKNSFILKKFCEYKS